MNRLDAIQKLMDEQMKREGPGLVMGERYAYHRCGQKIAIRIEGSKVVQLFPAMCPSCGAQIHHTCMQTGDVTIKEPDRG